MGQPNLRVELRRALKTGVRDLYTFNSMGDFQLPKVPALLDFVLDSSFYSKMVGAN